MEQLSIRQKLYGGFYLTGFGFLVSILFNLWQLRDKRPHAEFLCRPRQDAVLSSAPDAHRQWASTVQQNRLNEGKTPLTATLNGREGGFGKWLYAKEPWN